MSIVTLTDERRVARKEHRCESCGCVIASGRAYSYRSYVMYGELRTEKLHTWCREEMEWYVDAIGEDEFSFDAIQEAVYELLCEHGHDPEEVGALND